MGLRRDRRMRSGPGSMGARARARLRGLAERGLLRLSGPARSGPRARPGVVILAYHGIVPARNASSSSLHLPLPAFRAHLDALDREGVRVLPLAGIERVPSSPAPGPRVVITFDDAYAGALVIGAEELARRGLPGTFFVAPGILGGIRPWWDALGISGWEGDREPLRGLGGDGERIRRWSRGRDLPRPPAPADPMLRTAGLRELLDAARIPGIDFANHGWSHRVLPSLAPDAIETELRATTRFLRSIGIEPVPAIAYPYGLHCASVRDAARRAGLRSGFTIEGGRITRPPPDPFRIPRVLVPAGLSPRGLLLRVRGVLRR